MYHVHTVEVMGSRPVSPTTETPAHTSRGQGFLRSWARTRGQSWTRYCGDVPGNIEQLPSGSWRISFQHAGQRHRRTVPGTRRDAELALARLVTETGGVGAVAADGWTATVGHLIDLHLAQHGYAATTLADYRLIANRLPRDFLELPVQRVRPGVVAQLYERLALDGWSPHRRHRLHDLLGPAFKRALRWEWVTTSPVVAVAPPRIERPERHSPDIDQVRRLLDAATGSFEPWLLLAVHTGARRGEMCGLQWRDVDLDHSIVTVRRSVAYTPASGLVVKDTKTAKHRRVSLDLPVTVRLRQHRTDQAERLLYFGASQEAGTWLFTEHPKGEAPWRPDLATHRFNRLCRRLDVTGVRLHDIRHAAASYLLAEGHSPHEVAERLGHDPAVLMRVYAHVIPGRDQALAETMGRLYGRRG